MKCIQLTALTFLWITGILSTACAQAEKPPPPPPFGEEPPHQGEKSEERRRHIQHLEERIRDIEAALERKEESEERRAELRAKLDRTRAELKEILAKRGPQDERPKDHREHQMRLEAKILELERALENKDAKPEERKRLEDKLQNARAEMRKLAAGQQHHDGGPADPRSRDRAMERLRLIEAQLKEGKLSPEDREAFMAEAARLKSGMGGRPPGNPRLLIGTVTAVAPDMDLVVTSLGRDAGVSEGFEFTISRGEMFVGKIVIDRVDRAWSSGRITLKGKENPRIGDTVAINQLADQGRGPGQQPPMDPEMQKLHRQLQELDRQSADLGSRLRSTPKENSEEREKLTAKLKETVVTLFDLREKARTREVEMLKKRLEELTGLLDKRKVNRDAIIEKRIKQLSGENDELDW